ncbi:helix-turn-helix domain-containing protein [Allorhodopirellula heiligendammensis]|uniref:Transposase IS30-like HTH domain-containing protein n=1 Tax=Allorhodopirellula heiligendammensis TaxID=2714739 RepID=A0A5C6BV88_9BACT|nr:helix-turn-helix domain-containing protein [Allorhodopirellula heiligendammensis]TWU15978.1 hypothetical protein Poly21_31820 [Allorhodopirellula heiligendammensis]|tara:strand:- start:352 stop:735 length:384 start_codon:yes stop_codon:yes gene_type:complete
MREMVLRLLANGERPVEIASRLSVSYWAVRKIARESGLNYDGKHLTPEEKKEIKRLRELEGLPIRTIATRIGKSKSAVGNVTRRQFLKVQDQGGTVARPELLKAPKRCPRHGLMRLWPCVACLADPI